MFRGGKLIVGVVGSIGSGKTCMMSRCLYQEKLRNPSARICTNYKLEFEHEYINAQELFDMKNSLKNTILGIDEMHIFLDSRSSMLKDNKKMTHFVLQTRHLGVQLYFTTQDIGQVDIRLRRMLDYMLYMTRTEWENIFRCTIIDYTDVININKTTFFIDLSPYYDLYDTTEIIDIN